MRRQIVQVSGVLLLAAALTVGLAAAPTFVSYGGPGSDAGIRITGAGHADAFDPSGFPSQVVTVADNDNPYAFSLYNATAAGASFKGWIGNDKNAYLFATHGAQLGGGVGGLFLGAANVYPGYSVSLLGNGDKAGVFNDQGWHVRNLSDSADAALSASTGTFSSAAGVGTVPACLTSAGQLVRC